jgi:hypothetical protein
MSGFMRVLCVEGRPDQLRRSFWMVRASLMRVMWNIHGD